MTIIRDEITSWSTHLLQKHPLLEKKIQAVLKDQEVPAIKVFEEVIKFLYLVGTTKKRFGPSPIVDLAWHEFILFTKIYQQFCMEKFDKFIHHTPSDNKEENSNNFSNTIKHYIVTFGEPDRLIWGSFANDEWKSAQCGSCEAN